MCMDICQNKSYIEIQIFLFDNVIKCYLGRTVSPATISEWIIISTCIVCLCLLMVLHSNIWRSGYNQVIRYTKDLGDTPIQSAKI